MPYVCRRCKRGFARLSGISGHHCILLEEGIDIPIEIEATVAAAEENITVQESEVVTSIIIQETVTEVLKAQEEIVQSEIVSVVNWLRKRSDISCTLLLFSLSF